MLRFKSCLVFTNLSAALLLGGCAATPTPQAHLQDKPATEYASTPVQTVSPVAPAPAVATTTATAKADCGQIKAEMLGLEQARKAALEKEQNAWKAIVPFVVAARYASGKSEAEKTGRRLEELRAESNRQGCARDGIRHGA